MKRGTVTKKKPAVSDEGYRTLAAFRHTLRQFLAFSEEAARAAGLPPQQHQALLAIKGHARDEAMSVGDLAEHLLVRHNSAVELVNRLAAARLVAKVADKDDRRRVTLALTAKAEKILAALSAAHLAELRRSGPLLVELVGRIED
ncbi:MAG TPA: helix-turn-helix domain-containing protein [Parvibaculum sp.]|jgi:DNA-binding MarR family transcriptional regulator